MRINLKPCPFCGGSFEILCIDENDDMCDAEYLDDYPKERYRHDWRFGITHSAFQNPNCPIATFGKVLLGNQEYDYIEEAINMCNRRFTPKTT